MLSFYEIEQSSWFKSSFEHARSALTSFRRGYCGSGGCEVYESSPSVNYDFAQDATWETAISKII
jgi:hypothetical protein